MKGLPKSAVQRDNIVQVWFGSPTGDSSDSILLDIPCVSVQQASDLVEAYGKLITSEATIADLLMKLQSVTELLNLYYTGSIPFEAV
jgi:hypothetical protein